MKKINLVIFKTIKLNSMVERKIKKGALFQQISYLTNIKLTIKNKKFIFKHHIF